MTKMGLYIRIKRGERYENIDITEATETELRESLDTFPKEKVIVWVVAIVNWIKKNVESG